MNIIILGPQGSGKGTQAQKLAEKFDLEHIDMGKFLREVAKMDTPLGREVYRIQNVTKTLVPSRILEEVFTIKLNSLPRAKGVIFEGVPRTMDQAQYLEKVVREFGRKIDHVIFIEVSPEESFRRISKRRMCESCRKVFISGKDISESEEKCPECSGKIVRRIDDTREGVEKRLAVYREETLPVIQYFKKQGLVREVSGEGSVEEIFGKILKKLEQGK